MNLKTGSIVQLKSGGPRMTVEGIIGDNNNPIGNNIEISLTLAGFKKGDVHCQWFDDKNNIKTGCFKSQMLKEILE